MTDMPMKTETRTLTIELPVASPYYPFDPPPVITPEEMKSLEQAAKRDDPEACHKIGISYFHGINGKEQDKETALAYFEKGAEDHPKCAFNIGHNRLRKGLELNNRPLIQEGIAYFELSHRMGYKHAYPRLMSFCHELIDEYLDLLPDDLWPEFQRLALDEDGLPSTRIHLALHLLSLAAQEGDANAIFLRNLNEAWLAQDPEPTTKPG